MLTYTDLNRWECSLKGRVSSCGLEVRGRFYLVYCRHRFTINTRLQCARGACALGMGLTRPFRADIGRQILCKCDQRNVFTRYCLSINEYSCDAVVRPHALKSATSTFAHKALSTHCIARNMHSNCAGLNPR